MGLHFGELAKIRGLVSYKISAHEQRAFAGAVSNGLPNLFRRFRASVFRVAPPFIIGYLVYEGVEREHHRLSRKNPADYANDQ
ncbi:cytochrome b-c1 complex subunit 8 [Pectinophora gossypiella]|uniref:cytochrome b-c1 complex subunit 8 n=1 Tax=Pectinophora gossypiella TaxID=13191 RepID=UPI00214F0629|nr:cytochrome b-c1 complex subunit 8 [Pectinophora gossypiella]